MKKFAQKLIHFTEWYLTRRKKKKYVLKEKSRRRHFVVDTLDALLWAACMVLLINQYIFQLYVIPSSSMVTTLEENDRIFVNKFIYGPELIPGYGKINSPVKPQRGEVIIFENPNFIKVGPVEEVFRRVVFMLTFSLVNLDIDETGNMVHFLIKRGAAEDGDRTRNRGGKVEFLPPGEENWISEKEYLERLGLTDKTLYTKDELKLEEYSTAMKTYARYAFGVAATEEKEFLSSYRFEYSDYRTWTNAGEKETYKLHPQDKGFASGYYISEVGRYIPKGWILPLGDNRDNSRDGRFFGPIRKDKILGKAYIKYWPFNRAGAIE